MAEEEKISKPKATLIKRRKKDIKPAEQNGQQEEGENIRQQKTNEPKEKRKVVVVKKKKVIVKKSSSEKKTDSAPVQKDVSDAVKNRSASDSSSHSGSGLQPLSISAVNCFFTVNTCAPCIFFRISSGGIR